MKTLLGRGIFVLLMRVVRTIYTLPPILCLFKFLEQLKNPYFGRPNSNPVATMRLNPENPAAPREIDKITARTYFTWG